MYEDQIESTKALVDRFVDALSSEITPSHKYPSLVSTLESETTAHFEEVMEANVYYAHEESYEYYTEGIHHFMNAAQIAEKRSAQGAFASLDIILPTLEEALTRLETRFELYEEEKRAG